MSFQVGRTNLVITKPDGTFLKKEVILYTDPKLKTVGVKFVGESPLKGYSFDLMDTEIERIRASGVPMETLPDRV